MLILNRRQDEAIMIGDDIRIIVVRAGTVVRLGIDAPPNITIHRQEVYDAIRAEQEKPDAES